MRKFLVVVFFIFLFFSGAQNVSAAFLPAKSGLEQSSSGVNQLKVVQQLSKGTNQFEDKKIPNFDGLNARSTRNFFGMISLCAFENTECNGGASSRDGLTTMTAIPKMFALMYTPQATTGTYIADLMNTAGLNIARPVYAQGLGIGFASLDPVLDTWKVFRNVAYLFYVILFLIIGFMIMFRQKISGQAAVTAQQALPNIIVSLITVTFSYAIAGFLIDMMYIVMYLIIGLFPNQTFGTGTNTLSLRQVAMDKNIFEVALYLLTQGGLLSSAYDAISNLIASAFSESLRSVGQALGAIGGLTFAVVFALATLFGIFRLFFELLKTYISIVISIVLSPLALMLGALPGNNAFQAWLKTLIANLAIFPGILVILALSFILIGNTSVDPSLAATGTSVGGFLPPYIPGRGSGSAISLLLGLGVILILPDLAGQIKKSLGGSGGIFEQFANNFTSSLEKGWKGGELIPGLGMSDTRKWAGKSTGGLSGENIARKGALAGRAGLSSLSGGLAQTGLAGASKFENAIRDRSQWVQDKMPRPLLGKRYDPLKGFTGPHIEKSVKSLGQKMGDKQFNEEKKH